MSLRRRSCHCRLRFISRTVAPARVTVAVIPVLIMLNLENAVPRLVSVNFASSMSGACLLGPGSYCKTLCEEHYVDLSVAHLPVQCLQPLSPSPPEAVFTQVTSRLPEPQTDLRARKIAKGRTCLQVALDASADPPGQS